MTRDIRFRAKDIKAGKWVYGLPQQRSEVRSFANRNKDAEISHIVSFEPHRMLESGANDYCLFWYEIDPETLGEYIGRKDKEGNPIYEGDILGLDDPEDHSRAVVEYIRDGFKTRPVGGMIYSTDWDDWIVVGNIYENPDLLETPSHDPRTP